MIRMKQLPKDIYYLSIDKRPFQKCLDSERTLRQSPEHEISDDSETASRNI